MRPPRSDAFTEVYAHRAADYDRLVSREDHAGNLLPALRGIVALDGRDLVELGAGTGRLTRLLAPHVRTLRAFDLSPHMLGHAAMRLRALGHARVGLAVGDSRQVPVRSACADLVIEGWSFSHGVAWFPDAWREQIGLALGEMFRLLRPGGFAVAIESLGTGRTEPAPPDPSTGEYYSWLEAEHGFARVVVRTDYRFTSLAEAVELAGFFFGPELAARVRESGSTMVPECTGIWWRRIP